MAGQSAEFSSPNIGIGRTDTNEMVVTDYHLSGEHGQIFREADQYIYRDLRSTNGSALLRGGRTIQIDSGVNYEMALRSGDQLLLGDSASPVVLDVQVQEPEKASLGDVIASRSIVDLPAVADRVEHDPQAAVRIYKALSPLSSRLDMSDALGAVADATLALLTRSTHVAILLRSDGDENRYSLALARERDGALQAEDGNATVRASRAVLRRVLDERAAVLTANAQEEIEGSESLMGGRILSMIAVPLWRGDEIRGLIQADNRHSAGLFTETDLEVALLLGAQAALCLDNAALVSRLRIAEERARGENVYLKRREKTRRFESLVGESTAMKQVIAQLEKVLDTRATVCIEGETGTGKELIASAIHYQSKRRDKMFVAQNCAALPENLLESELFGHRKGAFTSADTDKKGLFEISDGGTLFLDEVGEMPLSLQAKLLRTLQEGTIRAVGSTSEKQIDVRIICATNRILSAEVDKGAFRQDLFYRLMVFPIKLPPLRERSEDIPALTQHFLDRYCSEYRRNIAGLSQECLDALANYQWPGNIRQLENEVQRIVIQADPGAWVEVDDLSPQIRQVEGTVARVAPKKGTLKQMMEQVERWLLAEALRDHGNNKTKTAQSLGITREGLHKKLAKFKMN